MLSGKIAIIMQQLINNARRSVLLLLCELAFVLYLTRKEELMIPTKYRNLTQIPAWPCCEQGRALKQCVPEGLRGALRHWSWPEQGKGDEACACFKLSHLAAQELQKNNAQEPSSLSRKVQGHRQRGANRVNMASLAMQRRFKHAKMSRGPAGLAWWPGILGVWGSRIQAYIGVVNQE